MNNTTRIMAIGLATLAVLATGCVTSDRERHEERNDQRHERAGQYIDDSVITAKLKTAIFNEPNLKSAEINVETFKGVVQLSGFVSSWSAERRAVSVARRVEGVRSVKNDMRVK